MAEDITPAEREEIDTHLKNWHFQSLWWGGEKIWNGELVRLMADAHVFQSGTSPITPTNDPQEVRLFFKISSIYKDSAYVLQDGEQPPAKMVGQLYELVETALVKNGKMKESMTTLHDEYFPEPPTPDYTFRRHGAADTDVHLELEYIAGRYYFPPARLRSKEAIAAVLARDEADIAAAENGDEAPLSHDMRLLTLAGVVPAYRLYMKVRTHAFYFLFRHETLTRSLSSVTSGKRIGFKFSKMLRRRLWFVHFCYHSLICQLAN